MDSTHIRPPKESATDRVYSVVKGIIGAIPVAGSLAAEIFSLILVPPINKRREEWMNAVANKLQALELDYQDYSIENLKDNPEFVSFLIESTQVALKTHQEEKLLALQNGIFNFFLAESIEYDKKYSFVKIMDEISAFHMNVLAFLAKNENHIITEIRGYEALHQLYSVNKDSVDKFFFRKSVRDLEAHSLIRVSGDFRDFIRGTGFATDSGAPSIKVLDLGHDFLRFISDGYKEQQQS